MICHAPESDHGWVYLSLRRGTGETATWELAMGYPFTEAPLVFFQNAGINLPQDSLSAKWSAGIHAQFTIPTTAAFEELASFIAAIMRDVQSVSEEASIELALEYHD